MPLFDGRQPACGRVAEIVMVLVVWGEMRGRRDPMPVESELAPETMGLLVQLGVGLKPRDLLSGDTVRGLVEDLGLGGERGDQSLSIAGKLLTTKKKIPRFTFEKFPGSEPKLTTQMKSVGEAMAIG